MAANNNNGASDPLLLIKELNVFRRNKHILKGLSCEARRGEILGLIGANGSGKSTLLKTIIGLLTAQSGCIELNGRNVNSLKPRELARKIAYMAQENECAWPLSVQRIVELGRIPWLGSWQSPNLQDKEVVDHALDAVDASHLATRTVTRLSGGERRRVLLARALATEPEILLADEPAAGLDPFHQLHLMDLFRVEADRGRTILVVLHDLTLASRFADRLILLDKGSVLAEGPPEDVLGPEQLQQAYSITARTLNGNGRQTIIPWNRGGLPT